MIIKLNFLQNSHKTINGVLFLWRDCMTAAKKNSVINLYVCWIEAGSHNDKSTYTNEIYMGMKTSKFKALRPVWPGVLSIDCHIRVFLTHVCIILS